MYVATYMHIYIKTYMYIHTCTHTYIHTYIQTNKHTHTYIHTNKHTSTHTRTHIHTPLHTTKICLLKIKRQLRAESPLLFAYFKTVLFKNMPNFAAPWGT